MGILGKTSSRRDDPTPILRVTDSYVRLYLGDATPSLNQLHKKWHWREARRWQDGARIALTSYLLKLKAEDAVTVALGRETRRARLQVERVGWSRILDDDNLHGGAKPLRDALVQIGLLRDDDDVALRGTEYLQTPCPRKQAQHTIIEVFFEED